MLKNIKKYSGFVIALSFLVVFSGCKLVDQDPGSNTVNNQTIDKRATLQGAVFDATTGARIGGTDLKMTLIQGTSHRSPSALITDTTNSLVGEYAFSEVPVNTAATVNITYKLVVTNTGYQRFEGNVAFTVGTAAALPGTTDATINFIGNVYLFPVGAAAPDLEFVVERDLEPVIGATVLLQQNAVSNVATAEVGTRLVATVGLLPSLTATTVADANDNAVATFSGANLVLGGGYTATVLPIKHEGLQLATTVVAGGPFIVGATVGPIVVALVDLVPGGQDDGLHAVFTSNRDTDDITGIGANAGRLIVVFNRAVELTTSAGTVFTAITNGAGAAVITNAGASGSVTVTLSADGLTLTLLPVYTTAPVAGDNNLFVTYAGGGIKILGDEGDKSFALTALAFLDGTLLSGVVQVVGP